ncbi:hypothetical protein BTN50_1907 [Candidatus Enterovibrio altilux]|uniref:Uncharacterized protein n=1 Tax=Candidatus Enterovibrio altilux TaxID=1927128 RepID=A0A291BBG1_9GAMM|nr:hypothetical protein BTN50_1907 [Candidatus Enterovibrio luxaltus]
MRIFNCITKIYKDSWILFSNLLTSRCYAFTIDALASELK